jgi:transcriptional regulator with XRE-family HTH domain
VNIGDRIRIARKAAGLSQEEVARRAGLSLKGMGEIERGDIEDPHISSLAKIARALGVPVEALFKEEEEPALVGKDEAPDLGRPSAIDVARDAARRQIDLENQAMFGDQSEPMLDQRHANEAMRRLREEHGFDANDAEALVDFALEHERLEEEHAQLREVRETSEA